MIAEAVDEEYGSVNEEGVGIRVSWNKDHQGTEATEQKASQFHSSSQLFPNKVLSQIIDKGNRCATLFL